MLSPRRAQVPYSRAATKALMHSVGVAPELPDGYESPDEADAGAADVGVGFCSAAAARALARAAYERALRLLLAGAAPADDCAVPADPTRDGGGAAAEGGGAAFSGAGLERALGVGCTASVVSGAPKRGRHEAYVARHDANGSTLYHVRSFKIGASSMEYVVTIVVCLRTFHNALIRFVLKNESSLHFL